MNSGRYIIVATAAENVGALQGHPIYRISGIDVLPVKDFTLKDRSEDTYLKLLSNHLEAATLYFSPSWDLTKSYQKQIGSVYRPWETAEERFFWNRYASLDLIELAKTKPSVGEFITLTIYGYAKFRQTSILGHPVSFGLITRRSSHRAGTRYFRRGIDEDGNVANFNETEQILIIPVSNDPADLDVQVFSYLQTRGSVPAYWAEINNLKYAPKLRVLGTSSLESAKKHFERQIEFYGKNYLVNLVNQSGREMTVKNLYENIVSSLGSPDLDYIYFDFHHECSKMRWERVQLLIDELLRRGLDKQGWYKARVGKRDSVVEQVQNGVVRTNCMDCLDRTNVVQSQLGRWVLQQQLVSAGVLQPNQHWENDKEFEFIFRNMWADNADAVSTAYSGTGALKTDFTRLGKRTVLGALSDFKNSITRYFKNNFLDGPRQDGFDLFLGHHLPFETVDPPFFDARPMSYQIIPYLLWGSLIMAFAAVIFPKEDTPWYFNRLFQLFWVGMFVYSSKFIINNGLQYVNWPKLSPLGFVKDLEVTKNGKVLGYIKAENTGSEPDDKYGKYEEEKKH